MDQFPPFIPLSRTPDASIAPIGQDAMAERVALLDAMTEDAQRLAHAVRLQAEDPDWVDTNDSSLFTRFGRTLRRSIMLTEKLEALARKLGQPVPGAEAARARRVVLLDAVARDAQFLGHMVRRRAERCSLVEAQYDIMFNSFGRTLRQSILLAIKLEDEARRRAAGEAEAVMPGASLTGASVREVPAAAAVEEVEQPVAVDEREAIDAPGKPEPAEPADRLYPLPDKPVGVIVAQLARSIRHPCDLRGFTDAELDFDPEHWRLMAGERRPPLPEGWIEGVDGTPVKIGVDRKDMFASVAVARAARVGRAAPD